MWLSSGIAVLCYRLAAVAPFQPLAWVLPYAVGAALKRQKKKKKERKEKEKTNPEVGLFFSYSKKPGIGIDGITRKLSNVFKRELSLFISAPLFSSQS